MVFKWNCLKIKKVYIDVINDKCNDIIEFKLENNNTIIEMKILIWLNTINLKYSSNMNNKR